MPKVPEVNISLKEIEKLFLNSNPLFKIVPLKIRMAFTDLTVEEIRDLEEYANVEDSSIERWILVPDTITIGALTYVVNRAFGLIPRIEENYIALSDEDWNRLVPTMGDFLDNCGTIFENPVDVNYDSLLNEMAYMSSSLIPPFLPSSVFPSSFTYEKCQETIKKELDKTFPKGIKVDGKTMPLRKCPPDITLFDDKLSKTELESLSENLCPDLLLKDVLQREGKKVYKLEDRPKEKRSNMERWTPKPFTHQLLMYHFGEDDYINYTFEITEPKSIYELINEGYLSQEEYLKAIRNVLYTFSPSCIYKKGYDLFGPDQNFYHAFIMALHGEDADSYRKEARDAGWREPYMDLEKVFQF